MNIRVLHCPDSYFKPYVVKAVQFFAEELIPNTRIRNNCHATIKFDNTLKVYGSCGAEGYNTRKEPREFLIEIHPGLGARGIIEAIAHEMVHVKQLIHHETNDDLSMWKGKKVDSDTLDYWIHPWEIDAHGREAGLLTKFAISEGLWEIFEDFKDPSLPITTLPIKWK